MELRLGQKTVGKAAETLRAAEFSQDEKKTGALAGIVKKMRGLNSINLSDDICWEFRGKSFQYQAYAMYSFNANGCCCQPMFIR